MSAGEFLFKDLSLVVPGEVGSGSQGTTCVKPNGILLYCNRGDSTGNIDEIVLALIDLKTGSLIAGPLFVPGARQFGTTGVSLFRIVCAPTDTGFGIIFDETQSSTTNRRKRYMHITDAGVIDIAPLNVINDATAQNNNLAHMRSNNAGTRMALLLSTEVTQGSDPRLFRVVEIDKSGSITAGPHQLDAAPPGAQVINIQNPRLAADLDDSGWGIFWGSNQGGSPPGGFWYAHMVSGGAIDVPKTQLFDTSPDENNLHDVCATTTGFGALLKREVSSRDTAFWVHINKNGTGATTPLNVSEAVQVLEGVPFDQNFVFSRGGHLKTDATNGGCHMMLSDRLRKEDPIEFAPSAVDPVGDTITIPEIGTGFSTLEANFSNIGGALPTPLTAGPGVHFISDEHLGTPGLFLVYNDFFDAIVDQNRIDILDQGSGTHIFNQTLTLIYWFYAHLSEGGTIDNGPYKVHFNPNQTAVVTEGNSMQLVDDDTILFTSDFKDEENNSVRGSSLVNRLTGEITEQWIRPETDFGGSFPQMFGCVVIPENPERRVAFFNNRFDPGGGTGNFFDAIDAFRRFIAIQDNGVNNLVIDNLEVSQ